MFIVSGLRLSNESLMNPKNVKLSRGELMACKTKGGDKKPKPKK